MAQLIADFNWASTRLGPIWTWPPSLRSAVFQTLRATVPVQIVWDGVVLYNDAYSVVAGDRHPGLLGTDAAPNPVRVSANVPLEPAKRRKNTVARAEQLRKFESLSPRERQVLMLVAHGCTCRQAGTELGISHRTVEVHRAHMLKKLGPEGLSALTRLIMINRQMFSAGK